MPKSLRAIVVGVSEPENDPAPGPAIELARQLKVDLHAVHAFDIPPALLRARPPGTPERQAREAIERQFGERLEAQVRSLDARIEVRCHSVAAPAGDTLVAVADQASASLIIVGATRQGPMMRHILGSTADRVIRTSTVPVLVLRPPTTTVFRRVLLTTDRSPLSTTALDAGARLALELGGGEAPEVRCLEASWVSEWIRPAIVPQQVRREGVEQLTRFLASLELPLANVAPRVRIGDPAKEIVAEAAEWNADLIVVGTRGRVGVSRFLLGSVAGSVLRTALSNVLVVPVAVRGVQNGPEAE